MLRSRALNAGHPAFNEGAIIRSRRGRSSREGITQRRVAHLVDLAFLPPDIVRSIVEARQPPTLTADRLIKSRHRMLWPDRRTWLSAI
jgi:hypothetical protein